MSRYIKESHGAISGNLSIEGFVGERRVFCEICTLKDRQEVIQRAEAAVFS